MRRRNSLEDKLIRNIDLRRRRERRQVHVDTGRVKIQAVYRNADGEMVSAVQPEGKTGEP